MEQDLKDSNKDDVKLPKDEREQLNNHQEEEEEQQHNKEEEDEEQDHEYEDDEDYDDEDYLDDMNDSIIGNYWKEEVALPEEKTTSNGAFTVENYNNDYSDMFKSNYSFEQKDQKVSFNDMKMIFHFEKHEIEKDPKSYFNGPEDDDEDDDDDEYYQNYYNRQQQYQQQYAYDDEEDEDITFDHDYQDDDSDDSSSEDSSELISDNSEDGNGQKKIYYQKHRVSQKFDASSEEEEQEDDEKKEEQDDEDNESTHSTEENIGVENILDESILKRYRFSSNSSEIETSHLLNIRDSIDKTKLEQLRQQQEEFDEKQRQQQQQEDQSSPTSGLRSWTRVKPIKFTPKIISPVKEPDQQEEKSKVLDDNDENDGYVEDFDDVIIHDDVDDPNISVIVLNSKKEQEQQQPQQQQQQETQSDEEEEEEEEEEEYNDDIIIHEDIENQNISDIINQSRSAVENQNNNSNDNDGDSEDETSSINWNEISESDLIDGGGGDENNEKIADIIKSRSILEGSLVDIRNKLENERSKLRDYFTKAKEDLKLSIENVSKYFLDGSNSIHNGGTDDFEKHQNELEAVSQSLVELESKIIEIEESLGKPSKHGKSSKPNKNQGKINALLSEIVSLKDQIEKEKIEKLNQDSELKDITNHLLDMASQLSNSIGNGNNAVFLNSSASTSPNSSSFVPSNSNNNNNNNVEHDIESYINQIKHLESRLLTWKNHNEKLHIEYLTDKQTNQKELLDLSVKIKKIEEERERLSSKVDDLVQIKGELEGREHVLESIIDRLKSDNKSLMETFSFMRDDAEEAQERFNQLISELKEIGQNTVTKLQSIIDELILERSALQSSIKDAELERLDLVQQLSTITDRLHSSENSHQKLLVSTESTIKSLESSESKCNNLQNQLDIVNKKLSWAESEVDRLTKEMDRLIQINSDSREQEMSHIKEEKLRIKSSFSIIRDQVQGIKKLLYHEKNEIIQLGTDISIILEKGKTNTSKTIKSLRDFVLKEVETAKLDINNKLSEIETNLSQNQSQDQLAQIDTSQVLLNEMNQQKSKLNEMQLKIVKMESQINEISETNNHNMDLITLNNNNNNSSATSAVINNQNWERDQVIQLMKLENKVRKIEAGISEIIEYKPPQQTTTPLPVSTTTITTTTTTHHTYTNDNLNEEILSPSLISSPINDHIDISANSGPTTTGNINEIINNSTTSTLLPDNIASVQLPITATTSTPKPSNINDFDETKTILLDSLIFGTGSILSIVFYQLMYNNKTNQEILSIFKSSWKYGLIFSSLGGIIKFTSFLTTSSLNKQKQQQRQTLKSPKSSKQQPNSTTMTKSTTKEIIVSSIISATIFSGFLYLKTKRPIDLVTGGLIGLANGLLFKYKS